MFSKIRCISSLEEHQEIVKNVKLRGCKASNLFMMPADLTERITHRRWFYSEDEACVMFLEDNDTFYRCYYYMNVDLTIPIFDSDKYMVIEFPYNVELREKQLRQIDKIREMGFMLGRESSEMILDARDAHFMNDVKNISLANISESKQIYDLLASTFNPLYAFLPTIDEIVRKIGKQEIIVYRIGTEISGVLNSDCENGIAVIRHVAVRQENRGTGIGVLLINAYLNKYKEEATKYLHWVDINNDIAVSIYRKIGYNFGVKKANEYIRSCMQV